MNGRRRSSRSAATIRRQTGDAYGGVVRHDLDVIADVIETERLLLRRWQVDDLEAFARLASDPRVV
jgi:RimJ/RimL family protein N-acetyltransferase